MSCKGPCLLLCDRLCKHQANITMSGLQYCTALGTCRLVCCRIAWNGNMALMQTPAREPCVTINCQHRAAECFEHDQTCAVSAGQQSRLNNSCLTSLACHLMWHHLPCVWDSALGLDNSLDTCTVSDFHCCMVHPHEYNSLHLNVSQHQLARLLVQEYCHVGLLVGVGGDNQALNLRGRSGGPKGRQLGFDRPCDSAIPWAALLELLSFLPGVCITSSCMCAWLSWKTTAKT